MRFFSLIFAALAAVALAQTQQNYINVPNGGFNVVAGQPFTITWSNPSSGDVTIRLTQGNNVTPDSGTVLTTVPASAGTATFNIPNTVNNGQYNFEIVDNTNTNNINFSSAFQIAGATETASSSASSASSSASSSSSASASSSSTSTSTSSSSSSSSSSSASSSSSSTASQTSSASASRTSSSASASATTSAPSSNGASVAQAGGLLAIMAGAIAVF